MYSMQWNLNNYFYQDKIYAMAHDILGYKQFNNFLSTILTYLQ